MGGWRGGRKGRYYVAAWGVGSFREVDQKKIPLPRPSLFIIFGCDVGSHDFELLLYRLTAGGRRGESEINGGERERERALTKMLPPGQKRTVFVPFFLLLLLFGEDSQGVANICRYGGHRHGGRISREICYKENRTFFPGGNSHTFPIWMKREKNMAFFVPTC